MCGAEVEKGEVPSPPWKPRVIVATPWQRRAGFLLCHCLWILKTTTPGFQAAGRAESDLHVRKLPLVAVESDWRGEAGGGKTVRRLLLCSR